MLVRGKWRDALRAVELSLTSYVTGDGERRVRVDAAGRLARTIFRRVKVWPQRDPPVALLEAELETGRTHQIRVHLTHLGFPLAGDDKYGDFAWNKALARARAEADVPARAPDPLRASGRRPRGRRRGAARAATSRRSSRASMQRRWLNAVAFAPRRFRFVVFDWDGTLADSTAIIADALQQACRDVGEPVPDDVDARYVIGLGLADALRHVAPDLPPERHPELVARYRHHYLARDAAIPLFAGVREMLAELDAAGYLLGVATGKSRAGLDRALAQHGIGGFFAATRCADEGFPKPHPDMLLHLMERVGAGPGETLMIGDTTHDLAARAQRRRGGAGGRLRRARAGGARATAAARDRAFDRGASRVAARQRVMGRTSSRAIRRRSGPSQAHRLKPPSG